MPTDAVHSTERIFLSFLACHAFEVSCWCWLLFMTFSTVLANLLSVCRVCFIVLCQCQRPADERANANAEKFLKKLFYINLWCAKRQSSSISLADTTNMLMLLVCAHKERLRRVEWIERWQKSLNFNVVHAVVRYFFWKYKNIIDSAPANFLEPIRHWAESRLETLTKRFTKQTDEVRSHVVSLRRNVTSAGLFVQMSELSEFTAWIGLIGNYLALLGAKCFCKFMWSNKNVFFRWHMAVSNHSHCGQS